MNNLILVNLFRFPKYILGFIFTIVFRLITPALGLSNISPLMATELAGTKGFGPVAGGVYGFLSMVILDLIVGRVGMWTLVTGICYGIVGFWGGYYLKSRDAKARNFVLASVIGTLFFDLVTGVLMGPLLFDQSFYSAFVGQIPFTIKHLAGNIFFAIVLAPWFYNKIIENPKIELSKIFKIS
jgi:uncharacterized membrane protein